ncbi:hypothetical protein ID47_07610 [Candidatus Paracaedibacter acanthamoebae]|uniref:Uncharacterized protein n=1 Tax=Candidatus Odyssella acanthamoebae TaxID=91604 RepID=A0A077AW42_9PROT|nr:hypothetical protein ID47_07610 [Candidatus Paracaedibacter acanthamoebae]
MEIPKSEIGGNFKVVYFNESECSQVHFMPQQPLKTDYPLLQTPHRLVFSKRKMTIPICDFGVNDVYDEMFSNKQEIDDFENIYTRSYRKETDHRIGGIPSLFQQVYEDELLLLQLSIGCDIYFGTKLINFIISDRDLKLKNFGNVRHEIHSR